MAVRLPNRDRLLGLLARWGASGSGGWLDSELRRDLKHKGAREADGFGELVTRADVLEVHGSGVSLTDLLPVAVGRLTARVRASREELARAFLSGGVGGSTPVVPGAALPHARLSRVRPPRLLLARSRRGVALPPTRKSRPWTARTVHALFFLVGSRDEPLRHLRLLAELAARADDPGFLSRFMAIEPPKALRRVVLEAERQPPSQYPRRPPRA